MYGAYFIDVTKLGIVIVLFVMFAKVAYVDCWDPDDYEANPNTFNEPFFGKVKEEGNVTVIIDSGYRVC